MQPVTHLNYQIDRLKLLAESQSVKNEAEVYTDPRYPGCKIPGYLIKHYTSEYTTKIMNDLGVQGKSRFYWLHPFTKIPEHIDNATLCGINFVLTENASPITFGTIDYHYKSIIVNTTIPHSVTNNENERVLFKISVFDTTYEQMVEKLQHYHSC
jgi:hypothetical protein